MLSLRVAKPLGGRLSTPKFRGIHFSEGCRCPCLASRNRNKKGQGFYNAYFIVLNKGAALHQILDLHILNRALPRLPFKMLMASISVQSPALRALPIDPCLYKSHRGSPCSPQRAGHTLPNVEDLFSQYGLGQTDDTPHTGTCPVSVELPEYVQEQECGPTETILEAAGAYGSCSGSFTAGAAPYESPAEGVAARHSPGQSDTDLPPNLHPVVRPYVLPDRSTPGTGLQACCGTHRCLHHWLGSHTAPRLFAYINRQGGLRSGHMSQLARHLLLWSQKRLRSLRAIHIPGLQPTSCHKLRSPENENSILRLVQLIWEHSARMHWPRGLRKYAFRPVSLLTQTLCKISEDKEQVLLVAPYWPTRTWFPELMLLVLDDLPQGVADTITLARAQSMRLRAPFLQQVLEPRLSPSNLKVYVAAIAAYHDPIEQKSWASMTWDQVVSLQALPLEEADPALAFLCPVRALRLYVDRTQSFRTSDQLFVCYGRRECHLQEENGPLDSGCALPTQVASSLN
ncbi:Sodium channel protein type 10 subunit alpha [Labeo rohita]|uniref:Sodium channel protein type 10 subunit alpha n=1 Tax=Labeo rohita TaxID=84645 RepID=A0ABQ8L358_LABRO|nr:Sodium channel protein type 10 subunit alpha [Labeo rohita]